MKKILVIALTIAVLAAGAFAAMQFFGGPAETTVIAETPETEPAELTSQRIVVDAKVVPARNADLSLATSGIVAEILVAEGDSVQTGQVLLKLESAREAAAVAQAQAQLSRTQAQLAEAQAGARSQEITSAEATLEAAQARLDRSPGAMQTRRATVEHPFGTLKAWMGSTHFLTKTLDHVSTEMSLHVLAYNLKRAINLVGARKLIEAA